jgi:hypothetical protein
MYSWRPKLCWTNAITGQFANSPGECNILMELVCVFAGWGGIFLSGFTAHVTSELDAHASPTYHKISRKKLLTSFVNLCRHATRHSSLGQQFPTDDMKHLCRSNKNVEFTYSKFLFFFRKATSLGWNTWCCNRWNVAIFLKVFDNVRIVEQFWGISHFRLITSKIVTLV